MNSIEIKAEQAAYWRFVRQAPVVAVEALSEDLLVVTQGRKFLIVEVKVSASDLRQDRFKPKHADIRQVLGTPLLDGQVGYHSDPLTYGFVPNSFYFAVPKELESKALEILTELYPYAGLITIGRIGTTFLGRASTVVKTPELIHSKRLGLKVLSRVVKAQSASLANAYGRIMTLVENKEFANA